jgi:hypothetical protein
MLQWICVVSVKHITLKYAPLFIVFSIIPDNDHQGFIKFKALKERSYYKIIWL